MVIDNSALVVMDAHAHLSRTEVIGLLGGDFRSHLGTLHIHVAAPCDSVSTDMQCEMDPGTNMTRGRDGWPCAAVHVSSLLLGKPLRLQDIGSWGTHKSLLERTSMGAGGCLLVTGHEEKLFLLRVLVLLHSKVV